MKLLATMLVLSMVMFLMAGCGRSVKVGTSAIVINRIRSQIRIHQRIKYLT